MHRVSDSPSSFGLKLFEQRRHVVISIRTDQSECFRAQRIDACIDVSPGHWLLLEANDINAVSLHDAERVLPLMLANSHRCERYMPGVKIEEFAIPYIGQDIAIGDHERHRRNRIKQA